jgi:tetratricopeptide (TPR) repeat protein
MQRFLLSLLIILGSSSLFAQSIEDIEAQFGKGELDKAKTSVDAFLTKEKNAAKPDGWWYKGLIYNEIAKSEKYKSLAPDGRMDAFNAFKKYYELDPKAIRATLEQHVRLFDIYNGYFDLGVAGFGASKFDDSYASFKNALMVEEYIAGKGYEYNGFKFPAFDTTLIQNIALSAYRAKKDDDAVIYYKKIADQRIAGKDNVDVYQLLIEYYIKKGDKVNAEKYFALGRELYPGLRIVGTKWNLSK